MQASGSKQQRQTDTVRRQQTDSRQAADSSMQVHSPEEARRGREATAPCLFCAAGSSRHQETDRQQTDSRGRQSAQAADRQAADSSSILSAEEARRGREAAAPCLFCAAGSSSIRYQGTDRQQVANNTDRQTVCEKEGREVEDTSCDARNWNDLVAGVQAPMALGAGAPVEGVMEARETSGVALR